MQLNLLVRSLMAALAVTQTKRAAPQRLSAGGTKPTPFTFLSEEERRANAERDAFNAKVNTRQVRRRLSRPWKQRAAI